MGLKMGPVARVAGGLGQRPAQPLELELREPLARKGRQLRLEHESEDRFLAPLGMTNLNPMLWLAAPWGFWPWIRGPFLRGTRSLRASRRSTARRPPYRGGRGRTG